MTAKKVKITVTATNAPAPDYVAFAMSSNYLDGGGNQNGNSLNFNANTGQFKLEFDLSDRTSSPALGLAFMSNPSDAMWVGAPGASSCPTGPGDGGGAIDFPPNDNANKLDVTNENLAQANLHFALRFNGNAIGSSQPPYVFDPIISNGGKTVL